MSNSRKTVQAAGTGTDRHLEPDFTHAELLQAWEEMDKHFRITEPRTSDEIDCTQVAERYGISRRAAYDRLMDMERRGLMTSRIITGAGIRTTRVWKFNKQEEIP